MFASQVQLEPLEQRQFLSLTPVIQTNLVSDRANVALNTDPGLKNAWGILVSPTTQALWVADNATGLATSYGQDGTKVLTVILPHGVDSAAAAPTGIAFNPTNNFTITNGKRTAPATMLFASEDGTISAWNGLIDARDAKLVVDNSAAGSVYKGLAVARLRGRSLLYAADFHNNRIDVRDFHFTPATLAGNFKDPNLPAGFAPFNIQRFGGTALFVTYAMQDGAKHDDVPGAGLGVIDVFSLDGRFIRRFATGGALNAPWGMAQGPLPSRFAGDLLVGNFGDGKVNVFALSGKFLGTLQDQAGTTVSIDGLWGLAAGDRANASGTVPIFFAAGPNAEANGLLGALSTEPLNPVLP